MIRFIRRNKKQILKFAIVGLGSTFLNFAVYSFVYSATNLINLASFLGYLFGLLNSFYFSDKWVFSNSRDKKLNYALFLFLIIYIFGGFEMTLIIYFINNLVQNHKIAWVCGAFIAAANNYICSKYFLFND